MYKLIILCSTVGFLFAGSLQGQSLEAGYGQFGAMIYWQGALPKTGKAEIRRTGAGNTESVSWDIRIAETVEDFQRNVDRLPRVFEGLFPFTDASAEYYLDKVRSANTIETVPMSHMPNVLFALGLAVWDTTVVVGGAYRYQVFIDNAPVGEAVALEAVLPPAPDWTPRFISSTNNERIIRSRWHIPADKQSEVYAFLAYRTAPFEQDYQLIQGVEAFSVNGDTINAVFMDTSSLNTPGIYQYMIRTFDRFGFLSPPSEYAEGSNFTPTAEPLIVYFKAQGLEDQPAIALKWKLINPWRVRSLALYRSREWSGPYELVGHVSQNDSTYLDPVTDVMESYFYYFTYEDLVQKQPVKSVTVTSVSAYAWPAEIPDSVTVSPEGKTIQVEWKRAGFQDRGYYVLRSEGYGPAADIVSGFIPVADSTLYYTWTDTSSNLEPGKYYSYSVISESIGYEKSAPTEPVQAKTEVAVYIPAPSNLKLIRQDDTTFLLRWDDLSSVEENLLFGYQVYQKDKNAKDGFRVLTPEPLRFETNYYTLHHITPADTFIVRAYNIYGDASTRSEAVALNDPFFFKFGPEYLMGKNEEKGIRVKWNKPVRQDITGYALFRMTDDGQNSKIATLAADQTDYLDTRIKEGETYYYFITANTDNGVASEASALLTISR